MTGSVADEPVSEPSAAVLTAAKEAEANTDMELTAAEDAELNAVEETVPTAAEANELTAAEEAELNAVEETVPTAADEAKPTAALCPASVYMCHATHSVKPQQFIYHVVQLV